MDLNFIPETMDKKVEPNGTRSALEQNKMVHEESNARTPSAKLVRLNVVSTFSLV